MRKALARTALKALTAVGTVFIAACYGVRNVGAPLRRGVVVDARSGAPIPGVLVSCLDGGGGVLDQEVTSAGGGFEMRGDCAGWRAEDVDGAANGAYAPRTATFAPDEAIVLALDPAPQG